MKLNIYKHLTIEQQKEKNKKKDRRYLLRHFRILRSNNVSMSFISTRNIQQFLFDLVELREEKNV